MSPAEIVLTPNENTVDFTVKLEVAKDGKTLGKVEQNGQLQMVQSEEKYLVDSVWIANIGDVRQFLENM